MKQIYAILLFLLFAATGLCTDPVRGYIVTKNGHKLTGFIGELYHSQFVSIVVFINDFGSLYNIEAERIWGFVYKDERGYTAFESKNWRNRWFFLRILEKGGTINLYQSPEEEHTVRIENGLLTTDSHRITEYWVEIKNKRQPTRINRLNFRRKMRRLFQKENAPDYKEKIGKDGYRFLNLPNIIREYNKDRSVNKRQI